MVETIQDLYKFYEEEAKKRAGSGYISNRVRNFIRKFSKDNSITMLVEDAMLHAFCHEYPSILIKPSYFHSICCKAWEVTVDDNGVTFINTSKQKIIKSRIRKVYKENVIDNDGDIHE